MIPELGDESIGVGTGWKQELGGIGTRVSRREGVADGRVCTSTPRWQKLKHPVDVQLLAASPE